MAKGFETLRQSLEPFSDFNRPWYVCGGWAIDLFLDHVTRPHRDIDLAIARDDQIALQRFLLDRGWRLSFMDTGRPRPWIDGSRLEPPYHEVWAEHPDAGVQRLEFLMNEIDGNLFRFRRDSSITMPKDEAWFASSLGPLALTPELILLYKANQPKKDINLHDFHSIVPRLAPERSAWLRSGLITIDRDHPWLAGLR